MSYLSRRTFTFLLGCSCLSSPPASGQALWTELSTIGYGGAALGLGVAACWSCDYETAGVVILAAGVGGAILGNRIGAAAERAVRRGERPTPGQLLGARIGTVTGFAALGAGLAALIINETGGNAPGEDERNLALMTVAGAGLGLFVEVMEERGLPPATSSAFHVFAGPGKGGALRLGLSHTLE
jgi:hypothetical protein